jgi:Ca2+-binding RTX toxin-like protein
MAPPIVQNIDQIILINGTIAASEFFTANDPDNDTFTNYELEDLSSASSTGRFELNGVGQNNGSRISIGAGQLVNLLYVGGTSIGSETIRIRAQAGGEWSQWVDAIAYTVRSNVTAPIVNASNFSVLSPELFSASDFIDAYDPDGWPIVNYFIRDRRIGEGKFVLNGVELEERKTFKVSAAEFENLYYQGAANFANEPIDIWVHDGAQLSQRQGIVASTRENVNRPSVFYERINIPVDGARTVFPLLDWIDPDGNTIKALAIRDGSPQSFSNQLRFRGVPRDAQAWINVQAEDFGELEILGANRNHSSPIFVRLFDGRHWSTIQRLDIDSVVRPTVASDSFVIEEHLVGLPLNEVFDKTDPGPNPVSYELVDGTDEFTSGRFQLGTTIFGSNELIEASRAQFNNMVFRTATFGARQLDDIYVRPNNGTFKGIWERVEVSTEPNYSELLFQVDGPNFNDWIDWNTLGGQDPLTITYSFTQTKDYNPGDVIPADPLQTDGYASFTTTQRIATRQIFAELERVTNVQFVEVGDQGTDQFGRKGGLVRLGNYVDPDDDSPVALSAVPDDTIAFQPGGDVWLNAAKIDLDDISPGTGTFYLMMGQIATAMGVVGPGVFPNQQAWSNFTVKTSAFSRFFVHGGFEIPSNYSLYDIYAFQTLYEANSGGNSGDDLYDINVWQGGAQDRIQTIWDGGGNDTISAFGSVRRAEIDLREGQFSTIGAIPENVAISWNSHIENAIGSARNDIIQGNHLANVLDGRGGNDTIISGSGDDTLIGGAGNDTFVYHVADGNDTINEQLLAGTESLQLESFPTLNEFSVDLAFRRGGQGGRDLIVDLVLDGEEPQGSVTIKDHRWGGSRVETLTLWNGTSVDLENLYSQTTTSNQNFEILGTSSSNGFLVSPV